MRKNLLLILSALLLLGAGQVFARDLKVVFSQYTPPYVLDNGNGVTVDIVRTALSSAGYSVTPVFLPIGQGFVLFSKQRADVSTLIREDSGLDSNYSEVFIEYHNKAFALRDRQFEIKGIADLKGRKIIAFQDAHKYLGAAYTQMARSNRQYREMGNQERQVLLFLTRQAEVAVMDESVFRFYREKLIAEGKVDRSVEVDAIALFPPTPFKAAFIDKRVRDDFNRGLAAMRRDGRYEAIYRKYIEDYFAIKP